MKQNFAIATSTGRERQTDTTWLHRKDGNSTPRTNKPRATRTVSPCSEGLASARPLIDTLKVLARIDIPADIHVQDIERTL